MNRWLAGLYRYLCRSAEAKRQGAERNTPSPQSNATTYWIY